MLDNLFNNPFLTSLALTLLHFLWQGLLVAAVLKSALLIFNNNKPQLRYALSALAMFTNLLLPIITFVIIYKVEVSSANSFVNSLALNDLILELKQPDALFSFKELTEKLPLLLPYLSVLWLATITLLAGKLLLEVATVNKLPQQGTVQPSDELQARFDELAKQIQLKVAPRLLISLKVDVPMAIGWLKPVVLLPVNMISGLNNAQLEMLILHELAHIRRHDYLVNFLQTLVETLLFFHPGVLWVSKQMRNEREYCSDDIAVHHCGDAIAYAHTLADTASLCTKVHHHHHTIPDMAMAATGGDLKQRVVRLVDHHCAPKNNISKWFASATIIFSVLLLSSKQMLTMPLLDIWYNENPWKQSSFNLISPESKAVKETTIQNSQTNEVPNDSIAQQLLTPQQESSKQSNNKQQVTPEKLVQSNERESLSLIAQKIQARKNAEIKALKNQKLLSSNLQKTNTTIDSAQYSKKLNTLSSHSSVQPKDHIESTITKNSLMVEEAFERTNTSNPYQQELMTLASNEADNTTAIDINKNRMTDDSFHNDFLSKANEKSPTEINRTVEKLANIEFSKVKEIMPATPIWRNAEQLKSVDPVYPSIAKRKGIEIEVKVNFTIDVDGQIKNIQFAHQSKINYFKSSIRSAIKKWRFLPAKVDNKPVESQMSKVFAFSLQS